MMLGGAFGGALPDIDIEGSAVEKLGTKAAGGAGAVTKAVTTVSGGFLAKPMKLLRGLLKGIGRIINFFLGLIAGAWRWCAEHIFGNIYFFLYDLFGNKIGWSEEKPWTHRGGFTHSFLFMITALIFLLPVCLLCGSWDFLIGGELGVLSHLFADALCRSGVKFFWPWVPPIGFPNGEGKRKGNGIRLLPFHLLVRTGCDQLSDDDINVKHGEERKELKKLRRREKAWQKVFQILALFMMLLIVSGVGPGAGTVPFADAAFPRDSALFQTDPGNQQQGSQDGAQDQAGSREQENREEPGKSGASGSSPDSGNTQDAAGDSPDGKSSNVIGNSEVSVAAQDGRLTRDVDDGTRTVPEKKGKTSRTEGDVSISALPKGVMKMPDETLCVVGGGEIVAGNQENLDKSEWNFSDKEKARLMDTAEKNRHIVETAVAGTLQGASDAANAVGDAAQNGAAAAGDAIGSGANAVGEAASGTVNAAENSANEAKGLFEQLKDNAGNFHFGFLGFTPYTR